ncbi:MAG: putative secreted protein [Myxococcaceae bacterium]|nr:putative secreted protein [Myxococcaceae bacterium]
MPVAGGKCPNCGAPVEFRSGSSLTKVCDHCGQFVVRTDRGLDNLGRFADVAATEHSLVRGDRGTLGGRGFEVLGHLVLRHPMGGTWEDYHLRFDDGSWSWVSTAQGRWQEVAITRERFARSFDAVRVGDHLHLGAYGEFVVEEASSGTFASAAGELPFVARPGEKMAFLDLSGPDGARASVHFVGGHDARMVFVGRAIARADLHLEGRVGDAPVQAVATASIKCRNCGGDLPARLDPNALHVVCPYCNAIADSATHAIIAQQDAARASPWIPLGTQGTLQGVRWTVIGYVERSSVIEGERFRWKEYLLYHRDAGYRWIIEDEGVWRLGTPVAAADVDAAPLPRGVRYGQYYFALRNGSEAVVDRVLGEFYWRVAVGERVAARDYACGPRVLSSEESGTERNWTLADPISERDLFSALGLPAPSVPAAYSAPFRDAGSSSDGSIPTAVWVVVAVFVLMLLVAYDSCDSDSGSSGLGGGHGSVGVFGGFGGK